jgi:hypothetical protein
VAKQPNNNPEGWFELKINTHVYVTGLPTDVTSEEVNYFCLLDSILNLSMWIKMKTNYVISSLRIARP